MSEWREEILVDCLESLIDYRGKTPKKSEEGIVTLSAKSVKMGKIDYNQAYFISPDEYKKFMVRGFPKKGDILMTTEAPLGCIAKLDREGVSVAQRLLTLRGKKDVLDNDYLMYYLMSRRGQYELLSRASGSTVQGIKRSEFENVLIVLPELSEQKDIAITLSNLDQKITLLREQNQTLEELAQTLFKRWFVEFEFPNENGQPYKSSGGKMVESELGEIPEGWELLPMEDLVKVHNGYSYKGSELQESNVAMVTLKNFDRNGGFRFDGFKELVSDRYKEKHVVDVGDLIVAHTDLTQDAEVLGNPALIMKNEKYTELVVSMDLVKVESKHKSLNTEFLYYLMRDKRFKYHCKGYANGTTVLHLSKSAIPEYLFAFPKDMKVIEDFGAYAYSVYQKISNNIEEIQSLTKLRDTLLPKLMSGELRVNE